MQHRAARYEQLRAEGYVHSRAGGGTFVAAITPESLLTSGRAGADGSATAARAQLQRRAQALLNGASAAPLQWGAFTPRSA